MTEAASKSEDLWNPYKELLYNVTAYLNGDFGSGYSVHFEELLKKYKQTFFSLLQNPPKNAKNREELKKGMEEGLNIRELGHQVLSRELYQEAIILSDMYELNEFAALDLLCTAQIQMSYYPGLPRGLVAVLLYYDGRKCILSVLRMLVQARRGVLWCLKIPPEVEQFVTNYTDQLMESGLFTRIFELLKSLDLSKEIEKLQQNVALGGPRHQRQVIDLFNNIRLILADIVFLWASQSGLPKQPTISLISYLREQKFEEEASGKIDNVNLYLISAFLSAIDLSILHVREDGEDAVQSLPILAETGFIEGILNELSQDKPWQCDGLQAIAKFGFAVCLSSLRLVPQCQKMQNLIEQEDIFCDAAIEAKVFRYFTNIIFANDLVYTEDVLYKRYHNLITDFIVYMYSKVKELRIKADEIARTMQVYVNEGLEAPSNLPRHFEDFLFFVAKFYEKDPLKLKAMLEYWCPLDQANQNGSQKSPSRSVSLFKFVRLAGDVIPSTLFVPYLTMLSSLSGCQQASRYCFNMLKQTTSGLQTTLSWDHFFASFSQYYANLRQEMPLASDTVYRHRSTYLKGITPHEIQGLQAVLKLVKVIASHDEFSRMSLCEHPSWAPLSILLGLVSCSVPIPLKADILLTLAALSKSPETASQMWNNLEASQILITIPSTSSYQPRGIQTELDEVESRMEEYPLTRSLLELLDVLTEFGIPRALGAGPRVPGFDPYLTFIVNSVFLKFNARSYKNPEEKWEIASLCLRLFEKFIDQYVPDVTDFQNASKRDKLNSPPGFHIMVQLNTKSNVLNLLLFIIHEGITLFDTYKHFTGEQLIEKCTLSCMNIIEKGLILQARFFHLLSNTSFGVPMVQLSKLLMSINQYSSKPDHVLNIARYTNHQVNIPGHCWVAIRIITHLTSSTLIHNQLMNIILADIETSKTIRNGFVECLDATIESNEETDINSLTKESILTLLKQCLAYKAPNLSHFLLGFDLKKDVSSTIFQLPGVIDFPRTCIHSLFGLLKLALTRGVPVKPSLLESSYHMLYALCSNQKTSDPTLKLLRMIPNFLRDHILEGYGKINDGISNVNQLSWLLMTMAIEMKVCCRTKQINYMKQLTQLLVDMPQNENAFQLDPFSLVPADMKISLSNNLSVYTTLKDGIIANNLLIQLLIKFDFNIKEVVSPSWEFFDTNVLNTIISNCYTDSTPKLINIKKLHQILTDELGNVQGTAAVGQRQAIMREIQKVLVHALNINNSRRTAASMIKFVDAWRQVVEVLVIYVPYEILNPEEQQLLQIYILEQLLGKVVKVLLLPDIGNHLSGTTVLLLENLRKCHMYSEKQKSVLNKPADITASPSVVQSHTAALRVVLTNLVEWILTADVTAQKLRVNLYGALVTFLHLICVENYENLQVKDSLYVSRLDNSKLKIQNECYTIQLSSDMFSVFNEKLIEVLCHDCIGGKDICRMLAMASFSLLIALSGNVNWIIYLSGRGYLKHIIQSILDSDNDLRLIMEPVPENIKALYVYESKMSFLTRIATIRAGAELLLEQNLLSCLSNMKVFDYHPEISKYSPEQNDDMLDNFIPPISMRYLQLWLPTLHICEAILTSLGTENRSSVAQINHYLLSHLDVIEMILRTGSPLLSSTNLKELAIVTELIARTANNDLITILETSTVPQDNRAYLHRLQKLMLNLLPKFVLTENTIKELLLHSSTIDDTTYQTSERLLYAMKIVCNLMLYARNLIANHGIDHSGVGVIFQSTLTDTLNNFNGKQSKSFNDHLPSLGIIVQQLISTVQYYHKEKITLNFLQTKLNEIPVMNTVDLKDFMPTVQELFDLNTMRESVYETVAEKLKMKRLEIAYATFIIEHSLYLVWTHLDYYMLKAIAKTKKSIVGLNTSLNVDSNLPSSSEVMWRVSADDISNLKQGLVSIFTDSFSSHLLETAKDSSESDKGLIEVLLRKIKRLIQFVPVK